MHQEPFNPVVIVLVILVLSLFGLHLKHVSKQEQKANEQQAQEYFVHVCEPLITGWTSEGFLFEYYSILIQSTVCLVRRHKIGQDAQTVISGIFDGNDIYDEITKKRYSYNQFQMLLLKKIEGEIVIEYAKCIQKFHNSKKNAL